MTDDQPTGQRPGFTFGEVVDVMSVLYGLDPSKRDTFIGRLQQLQRLGIPSGSNVGRGAKARYLNWQVADLMLCLDLLDCGVPPATLGSYFGSVQPGGGIAQLFALGGMGYSIQQSLEPKQTEIFYLFQPHALGYLRTAGPYTGPIAHDLEQKTRTERQLVDQVRDKPAIVINVTARLRALREAVQRAAPSRADQIEFFPTKSAQRE